MKTFVFAISILLSASAFAGANSSYPVGGTAISSGSAVNWYNLSLKKDIERSTLLQAFNAAKQNCVDDGGVVLSTKALHEKINCDREGKTYSCQASSTVQCAAISASAPSSSRSGRYVCQAQCGEFYSYASQPRAYLFIFGKVTAESYLGMDDAFNRLSHACATLAATNYDEAYYNPKVIQSYEVVAEDNIGVFSAKIQDAYPSVSCYPFR